MNTLVLVLSSFVGQAPDAIPAPTWQRDYSQAQQMAIQAQKPLAVFLAPGQNGLDRLIQGGLSAQAKQMLAEKYVCVLVDTTTPEGQRLANSFQLRGTQGMVISDRGGVHQAYWFQGTLTSQDLVRSLQRYANLTNVRVTEVAAGRSSFYEPPAAQGTPDTQIRPASTQSPEVSTPPVENRRIRILNNVFNNEGRRMVLFQGRLFRRY